MSLGASVNCAAAACCGDGVVGDALPPVGVSWHWSDGASRGESASAVGGVCEDGAVGKTSSGRGNELLSAVALADEEVPNRSLLDDERSVADADGKREEEWGRGWNPTVLETDSFSEGSTEPARLPGCGTWLVRGGKKISDSYT